MGRSTLLEVRGYDGKLGGANGTKSEKGKERGKKECSKHVFFLQSNTASR